MNIDRDKFKELIKLLLSTTTISNEDNQKLALGKLVMTMLDTSEEKILEMPKR